MCICFVFVVAAVVFSLYFHLTTKDKQKIENEAKKQTQRESTIEVLEENLRICTAKVSGFITYNIFWPLINWHVLDDVYIYTYNK